LLPVKLILQPGQHQVGCLAGVVEIRLVAARFTTLAGVAGFELARLTAAGRRAGGRSFAPLPVCILRRSIARLSGLIALAALPLARLTRPGLLFPGTLRTSCTALSFARLAGLAIGGRIVSRSIRSLAAALLLGRTGALIRRCVLTGRAGTVAIGLLTAALFSVAGTVAGVLALGVGFAAIAGGLLRAAFGRRLRRITGRTLPGVERVLGLGARGVVRPLAASR
jgi:hypothetical protein